MDHYGWVIWARGSLWYARSGLIAVAIAIHYCVLPAWTLTLRCSQEKANFFVTFRRESNHVLSSVQLISDSWRGTVNTALQSMTLPLACQLRGLEVKAQ